MTGSTHRTWLVAAIVAADLLFAAVLGAALWGSRQQQVELAESTSQKLALALGYHLDGLFDKIDLGLRVAADSLERQLAHGAVDHQAMNARLADLAVSLPEIDVLRYSDAAGRVAGDAGVPSDTTPATSIADRDYFLALRGHPEAGMVSSKPLLGRSTKRWALVFARPYHAPGGGFAGVVYAGLALDDLNGMFRSLQLGKNGSVTLIDPDYAIIARYPMPTNASAWGKRISQDWIVRQLRDGRPTLTTSFVSGSDGIERTYSFQRLANRPYWAVVGRSTEESLALWLRHAALAAGVFVLFAGLTGLAGWRLQCGWRRQEEAERALRRERDLAQGYLDTVEAIIVALDAEGRVTLVNRKGCQLLGYQEHELVGRSWFATCLPQPEGMQITYPYFRRLLAGEVDPAVAEHYENAVVTRAGALRLIAWRNALLRDDRGRINGVLSAGEDITERKEAESALRIAATTFESQEGMFVTDAGGTILRVNRAFSELTGYSVAEAIGQTARLLQSGHHDAAFYREMWAALNRDGYWQGEIWNRRKSGEIYPEWQTITAVKNDVGAVTHYVAAFSDISERKDAETRIRNLAFYDPLTGLPNRRLLLDRLGQALAASTRTRTHGALLYLDLDHFKTLNDTRGHDAGDVLLTEVAGRIAHCVREGDTVSRLGGDEFVVMLGDLGPEQAAAAETAETVAEKIKDVLSRPYSIKGTPVHSTPSLGITLFVGHDETVEGLLKQADIALYQAKEGGRNCIRFYDSAMQASVEDRATLESSLRRAMAQTEFFLHYQPQFAADGHIYGAETLLRWQPPGEALIPPGRFIPIAEQSGLILPIGNWVLEQACMQLKRWEGSPDLAPLVLSVNVSIQQVRQGDFVQQVTQALERSGAEPRKLRLELTESLMIGNIDDVIAKMDALKGLGISFSMDDFGTGYSSLSQLKRLPLDELKIDQSFVRDIDTDADDATIVTTIIAMGHALRLHVIAEGVETEAQRDFLHLAGCGAYQGYLFARPMPLDSFESLVAGS